MATQSDFSRAERLCITSAVGVNIIRWQSELVLSKKSTDLEATEDYQLRLKKQRDLVSSAGRSANDLAKHFREALNLVEADLDVIPELRNSLSAEEVDISPQYETAQNIFESLSGLPRRIASQGPFWLLCHIRWLETRDLPDPPTCLLGSHARKVRVVGSTYADQGTGAIEIDDGDLDSATRTLLRYTGGLPTIRDSGAFWYDCPLAGAWWRMKLVQAAVDVGNGAFTPRGAYETLRERGIWEEWTRWVCRRSSRLAAPAALAGFVIASIRARDETTQAGGEIKSPARKDEANKMMRNLARRCKPMNLSAVNPETLADLCFD